MNDPKNQNTTTNDHEHLTHGNSRDVKTGIDALTDQIKFYREKTKTNSRWSRRIAVAAIAYTAFTFIIMIVAGYQAYLSRQTLIATQRAWIAITGIWHDQSVAFVPGAAINYVIELRNIGREPASRLSWRVENGYLDIQNHRLDVSRTNFSRDDMCRALRPNKGGEVIFPDTNAPLYGSADGKQLSLPFYPSPSISFCDDELTGRSWV